MIRTLVVDDDFRVADIHAGYVARVEGFTVVGTAHTAAAAAAAIRRLRPDLVLLDLYLPDANGLTLLRKLPEGEQAPPDFIVITAARDMPSVRAAMQLGAVHYLVKPFGFAQLAGRLNAYRDVRQRLDALHEATQDDVDALYGLLRPPGGSVPLPKGHSAPTMALVRQAVQTASGDLSASEVAELVGISRPTAQRYLATLVRQGLIGLRLRYGETGRPEHRYHATR